MPTALARDSPHVMAGLRPGAVLAIHVLVRHAFKDVDAGDKRGHVGKLTSCGLA